MCMFCAALPMVVGATAVAQGEQRKKLLASESHKQQASETLSPEHRIERDSVSVRRERTWLTPRRISQLGALAFVGLLFGSGFYHTHFPG